MARNHVLVIGNCEVEVSCIIVFTVKRKPIIALRYVACAVCCQRCLNIIRRHQRRHVYRDLARTRSETVFFQRLTKHLNQRPVEFTIIVITAVPRYRQVKSQYIAFSRKLFIIGLRLRKVHPIPVACCTHVKFHGERVTICNRRRAQSIVRIPAILIEIRRLQISACHIYSFAYRDITHSRRNGSNTAAYTSHNAIFNRCYCSIRASPNNPFFGNIRYNINCQCFSFTDNNVFRVFQSKFRFYILIINNRQVEESCVIVLAVKCKPIIVLCNRASANAACNKLCLHVISRYESIHTYNNCTLSRSKTIFFQRLTENLNQRPIEFAIIVIAAMPSNSQIKG